MTTFLLKMIALVLMVIDHIEFYFEGAPIWFGWLGRACYPLFLFCMVWGYYYTQDQKRYLLRLYLMSIFMTVFGYVIDRLMPTEEGYGNHNIFLPMFLVGVLISAIDLFRKDPQKGGLPLGGIVSVQVVYYMLPSLLPFLRNLSGDVLTGVIPNLYLNEYGFEFVALGVLMYYLKEKKELLVPVYVIFCINQFAMEMLQEGFAVQWLMILALPLMLLYNNQKGPGMKYFFYLFYPAHTFALFYLTHFAFGG